MPPLVAAIVGVAFAFLFGVAIGALRRAWRRRLGISMALLPWYLGGPREIELGAPRPSRRREP